MGKIAAVLLMMFMLFAGSKRAEAVDIVYTGPGTSLTNAWSLNPDYWLSAEFVLADDYVITDVMGWILNDHDTSGTAHISIYSDGGDTPGSTQHFTQQFTVSPNSEDWYGLSGLSWSLGAGTYWVAYEVMGVDTLFGGMRASSLIDPLGNEALSTISGASWSGYDPMNIGVWIEGTTASVPEPATLLLLGSGMLGFGLFRRMREEG